MKRLKQRLIVIGGVALLALAVWKIGMAMGWIPADHCVPGRHEERDAAGKIVRIEVRSCF